MTETITLTDGDGARLTDGDDAVLVFRDGRAELPAPMAPARFAAADAPSFLAGLQALLLRGLAWRQDADAVLTRLLSAVADGLARLHRRTLDVLEETDPRTTRALLSEWEAMAGLPDPCAGAAGTLQERRAQLLAKLTARGGQSIAYLEGVAAAIGYTVTIEESPRFRCGQSRCGQRLGGRIAAHTLRVRAGAAPVTKFRAGVSAAGDRLGAIHTNAAMECVIRRAAPAHAVVVFDYGG